METLCSVSLAVTFASKQWRNSSEELQVPWSGQLPSCKQRMFLLLFCTPILTPPAFSSSKHLSVGPSPPRFAFRLWSQRDFSQADGLEEVLQVRPAGTSASPPSASSHLLCQPAPHRAAAPSVEGTLFLPPSSFMQPGPVFYPGGCLPRRQSWRASCPLGGPYKASRLNGGELLKILHTRATFSISVVSLPQSQLPAMKIPLLSEFGGSSALDQVSSLPPFHRKVNKN